MSGPDRPEGTSVTSMNSATPVTTLFLDIGGILLTNGWDRNSRRMAAERFHLDHDEKGI